MEAASIMSEFNATSGGMAGSVVYAYAFGEGRRSGGFALILCGHLNGSVRLFMHHDTDRRQENANISQN